MHGSFNICAATAAAETKTINQGSLGWVRVRPKQFVLSILNNKQLLWYLIC